MTDIRDGFLYHPDGESPKAQMARLLSGEHNPVFDDPFSTTIQEVDDEIRAAERDRKKLLEQLTNLRRKMVDLRAHRTEVAEAVEQFENTGEIADVLIPSCRALLADERRALAEEDAPTKADEIESASGDLTAAIGDDWDVVEANADDEYVYITVRRERRVPAPSRPSTEDIKDRIVEKVKAVFEAYRQDFIGRTRLSPITMAPVNPRASP